MLKFTVFILFVLLALSADAKKSKKKKKNKLNQKITWLNGTARCPGKYVIEEGDELNIVSPGYPNNYPNRFDCTWRLKAIGCQFRVECSDMYTKPSCVGDTWQPLTKCQGDYLRFYSPEEANIEAPLNQRYCYTQKANFLGCNRQNEYAIQNQQ